MAEDRTCYYVQTSLVDDFFGSGRSWKTVKMSFDRGTAERYAESVENTVVFDHGDDGSKLVSTVARVITAESLRAETDDPSPNGERRVR
jgi:hypothetical protein